jgi:hypothetical protein
VGRWFEPSRRSHIKDKDQQLGCWSFFMSHKTTALAVLLKVFLPNQRAEL